MDYNKMSYVSGVIIFVGLIVVLLTILWLSSANILFTQDYSVYMKFTEVSGLRDQSPVYMRGYRIGTTKSVTFEPDGVVIRVEINKKFPVPRQSKFEITTLNLIGEKAITITPLPGQSQEPLNPDESVTGENRDVMIMAQSVLTSMKKKIEGNDIDAKLKQVGESLDMLHSVLGKLDTKLDQLNVAEYTRSIKTVGETGQRIQEFLNATQPEVVEVTREGKQALGKMNGALDSFSSLAQKLDTIALKVNSGQGTAGELVNNREYITDLARTVSEIQKLIEDIRKDPRKYFKFSVF